MKRQSFSLFFLLALLLPSSFLVAQHAKALISEGQRSAEPAGVCSGERQVVLAGVAYISENSNSWNRTIQTQRIHEQGNPLEVAEATRLNAQKLQDMATPELLEEGPDVSGTNAIDAINPVVVSSFNATALGSGNPPDNTMAISNGGYIVTAVNSRIAIYNASGSQLASSSLYDFFLGNNVPSNHFFDPVVLYDSGADRFVFVCVAGTTSATSRVLVAFSKTNNPTQGWNIYYLTGNPLGNSCWLDYPRVAVSGNEVYVTGNLYTNNNSFNQAVLYQITKSGGYSGINVQWQFWSNISGSPFTILPLSWGGQGNYGPGCYLVSHASNSASKTLLYDLTNYMTASNEQLLKYEITTPVFQQGTDALQKNTSERLKTGDTRIQSGFYQDGYVHYVFSARYNTTAWNAIHYHRIKVSDKTLTSRQVGSTGWDYVYPSVAWSGTSTNNKSVLIGLQYSNSTVFPSAAIAEVDNSNNVSPNVVVFAGGTGFVNLDNATASRWGDYTGLARRKNTTTAPRIWAASSYGNTAQSYTARIAEIRPGGSNVGDGSDDRAAELVPPADITAINSVADVTLFPNPVISGSPFNIGFSLTEKTFVRVDILAADGRLVHTLLEDAVRAGDTKVSFNPHALNPGVYAVRVSAADHVLKTVKLVVI